MRKVFIEADNIISPLGMTTDDNFASIRNGKSGIRIIERSSLSETPVPVSAIDFANIETAFRSIKGTYTRFEQLAILSIKQALEKTTQPIDKEKTLFILSTTKGNIDLLDTTTDSPFPESRLLLHETAQVIADFFQFKHTPVVVSNACISGISAIILGKRLIEQGLYDTVIVNGTDILSRFVISGFQSFMSLSATPCKPFDANRSGLTLGEASATVILSHKEQEIAVVDGATSNDANHISGPSRTGEGLFLAIRQTLQENHSVDFISAHGTATPYNDDMESIAIARANLAQVPVNSLKGYIGHTLGAAGIIESIINIEALKNNILIGTLGCETIGVAEKINIVQETKSQQLTTLLKLGSGFGGGNAAILFSKL